jgi:hypothetical protein
MSRNWFVYRGKQKHGPYSENQMASMIAAGKITQADLVWTAGMAEWKRLAETDLAPTPPVPQLQTNPFDFAPSQRQVASGRVQSVQRDPFDFTSSGGSGIDAGRRSPVRVHHRNRRKSGLGLLQASVGRHWWATFFLAWVIGCLGIWQFYKLQADREWDAYSEMMWAGHMAEKQRQSRFVDAADLSAAVGRSGGAIADYMDITRNGTARSRRNKALMVWSLISGVAAGTYFFGVVRKQRN